MRLAHEFGGIARDWNTLDECLCEADVIVSTLGPIARSSMCRGFSRSASEQASDRCSSSIWETRAISTQLSARSTTECSCTTSMTSKRPASETGRTRPRDRSRPQDHRGRDLTLRYDLNHKSTGPIIKQLSEQWQGVSQQELELLFRKLSHLARPIVRRLSGRLTAL